MTSLFALTGFEQVLANLLVAVPPPAETPSEFPELLNELNELAAADAGPDAEPAPVIGVVDPSAMKKKDLPVAQLLPDIPLSPDPQLSALVPAPAPLPAQSPVNPEAPPVSEPSLPTPPAPVVAVTATPVRPVQTSRLAFAARLVPIPTVPVEPQVEAEVAPPSATPDSTPRRTPTRLLPDVAAVAPLRATAGLRVDPVRAPVDAAPAPPRKPIAVVVARHEPGPAEPEARPTTPAPEPVAAILTPPAVEPALTKIDAAPQPKPAGPSEAVREVVSEPTPDKPPAIARDIRFEINSREHRVELRLMERGGEVRVAVRTPDAQLAGDLRDNLPALSSRLEQVGFRTETLHALSSAAPLETLRPMETATSANPRGSDPDSRNNSREQHGQPQHDQPHQRKQKGKEFEWLMSSLR